MWEESAGMGFEALARHTEKLSKNLSLRGKLELGSRTSAEH